MLHRINQGMKRESTKKGFVSSYEHVARVLSRPGRDVGFSEYLIHSIPRELHADMRQMLDRIIMTKMEARKITDAYSSRSKALRPMAMDDFLQAIYNLGRWYARIGNSVYAEKYAHILKRMGNPRHSELQRAIRLGRGRLGQRILSS